MLLNFKYIVYTINHFIISEIFIWQQVHTSHLSEGSKLKNYDSLYIKILAHVFT